MAVLGALVTAIILVRITRRSECGELDASLLSGASWAANVFGLSETAVALLTSPPGRAQENVLSNSDIANAREITNRYAGTGRVLSHTIVHPNLGPSELDAMAAFGFQRRNDEFLFGVRTINFSAKFVQGGSAGDRNNGAGLLFEYRRLLGH